MKRTLSLTILWIISLLCKAGDDFELLSLGNGIVLSGITDGKYYEMPTKFNSNFLFCRTDDINGYELWISDGTTSGTKLLKDIVPGSFGSYPHNFIIKGNEAIFTVARKNESTGYIIYELWKTDGTESGTQFIEKAFEFFSSTYPNENGFQKKFYFVGSYQNKIIYKYNNGYSGVEGWNTIALNRSNYTIENFPFNVNSYKVENGTQVVDKFMFSNIIAIDPFARKAHQYYITDGSESGTSILKNGTAPIFNKRENQHNFNSDYIWKNYTWNNTFFFYATDSNDLSAIFKLNPMNNQIEKVLTIMENSFLNNAGVTEVKFSNANNKLIIHLILKKNKYDNLSDPDSSATFVSDGTSIGTNKIEILNNQIRFLIEQLPNNSFLYKDFENNVKVFNFSNNTFGPTIDSPINKNWNDNLIAFNSNHYFVKNNFCYMLRGNEIIKTNGTSNGTNLVWKFNNEYPNSSYSRFLFELNNKLYFIIDNFFTDYSNLWYIDLLNDQINVLGSYESPYYPALNPYVSFETKNFITANNKTYFSGFNDDGQVAWKTEGTAATTIPIGKKLDGQTAFIDQHFGWFEANNKMYYGTYDNFLSLYVTTGNPNETIKLDSFPADIPYGINHFYKFNNEIYFVANDKTICKTNGTKTGTKRLKTITGKGVIGDFFEINGSLYIPAIGNNKEFIWKINSDGTLSAVYKWNDLPFNFNLNQVVTFFGVLNGKCIFEICDIKDLGTTTHKGKHHLMGFDGANIYYISNPTQTNTFKTKYAYFDNFIFKDNKLYFTTLGLTNGSKPAAIFANIGKDFEEEGYLYETQGQEGDLKQVKEFQETQSNIQCIEVFGIIELEFNSPYLKVHNNNIYTYLYFSLYPASSDFSYRSVFILDDNYEFQKVLDLEQDYDPSSILFSVVYFGNDNRIYGVVSQYNDDGINMNTYIISSDGLNLNSEIIYDTIVSEGPNLYYSIENEEIGLYKDKLYFLIKPIGLSLESEERMCEVDLTTRDSRVIPRPSNFSKIKNLNFNRNDGVLVNAFYKPTQIERPGTSLWLYNNSMSTSINQNALNGKLTLFPNPASNIIMFSVPDNFSTKTIEIYNLNGVLIKSNEIRLGENFQKIDISNYPNGTYILKVSNGSQTLNGKFVKME